MSTFQFYEFRSIDRSLNKEERRQIGRLSSRTTPTTNSATFVYHYGDFPADEESILIKYFDAMLYYANWGTQKLMFRLPKEAVNYYEMIQYNNLYEDDFSNGVSISKSGNYVVITIEFNKDEYTYEQNHEDYVEELSQWRQMLMNGDYSILFLAWLHTQQFISSDKEFNGEGVDEPYFDDETPQKTLRLPHIPSGIISSSGTLKDFIHFFKISPYWVNAVINLAQQSDTPASNKGEIDYKKLIDELPEATRNSYLYRLFNQEINLHLKLKNELEEIAGVSKSSQKLSKWTIDDLYNEIQKAEQAAKRKQQQETEEAARKKLAKLVADEPHIWKDVIFSIERFDRKGYEEATKDLKNLLEVARRLDKLEEYTTKLEEIKAKYSSKRSLIAMLKKIVY